MSSRVLALLVLSLALITPQAFAQSFEAGVHLAAAQWSEFDGTDLGLGGRLTWKPTSLIGVDADLTWYPSDFPDRIAFSANRFEGLFGVTVGPQMNRFRPFAKAAAGFLHSSEASVGFPCILIFPPPLNCLMATGHTMPAVEIGGGVDVRSSTRTFVRVDAGSRLIQYPGPSFRSDPLRVEDKEFWGGALRFTIGGGFRF